MKVKNYLLPYKWQIAGWAVLLTAFIAFNLIMNAGIGVMSERTLKNLLTVLIFTGSLSLLMIAFSKEKHEDEFVKSLRGRSLAITAGIAFVLSILWLLLWCLNVPFKPSDMESVRKTSIVLHIIEGYLSFIPMFFLYIVIFKISLWTYRWPGYIPAATGRCGRSIPPDHLRHRKREVHSFHRTRTETIGIFR